MMRENNGGTQVFKKTSIKKCKLGLRKVSEG